MYHSIGHLSFSVMPENFIKQLNVFKNQNNFGFVSEAYRRDYSVFLTFDDGYIDNYEILYPIISGKNIKINIFIATEFIGGKHHFGRDGYYDVLTSSMIREMAKSGLVEFGSHTHTHADLSKMTKTKILYELQKSKAILEDIIGNEIITFAFPYSSYNSIVPDILRQTGYKYAVTGDKGYISRYSNPYKLPRWGVGHKTKYLSFYLKASGFYKIPIISQLFSQLETT